MRVFPEPAGRVPPDIREGRLRPRHVVVEGLEALADALAEVVLDEERVVAVAGGRSALVCVIERREDGSGEVVHVGVDAVAVELLHPEGRNALAAEGLAEQVLVQIEDRVDASARQPVHDALNDPKVCMVEAPPVRLHARPHKAEAHHVEPPLPQVVYVHVRQGPPRIKRGVRGGWRVEGRRLDDHVNAVEEPLAAVPVHKVAAGRIHVNEAITQTDKKQRREEKPL
mmetsp:Transcript_13928/g.33149  ORF Transcript_13928/g.33149 Transcript_13928/m.33149 type:complete len:227 (-) Transcript_13928:214-894(-)